MQNSLWSENQLSALVKTHENCYQIYLSFVFIISICWEHYLYSYSIPVTCFVCCLFWSSFFFFNHLQVEVFMIKRYDSFYSWLIIQNCWLCTLLRLIRHWTNSYISLHNIMFQTKCHKQSGLTSTKEVLLVLDDL